jgi:hypothetical protein
MRQPLWRRWLMISFFGAVPMLGCRHADHECDCYSTRGPIVYTIPNAHPTTTTVIARPTPTQPVDTHRFEPTTVVETVARKPEPPPGTISIPVTAGTDSGTKTGTLELSTADAEAMGIKPGYTPGALFMSPK